ncbi:MAG: DUF1905 domain-containing protein [Lewinella sp.]|jgi:hypothetical protein|uniref:DUF1905 domain-containing protein n=1 Tax=Lewinella sp. TaxID=2004506 RepID=UPI003D6C6BDC
MKFQFSAPLEAASSKLFNWQVRVPADVTAAFLASPTKKRVVCILNGQDPHQCALTPIGDGVYVIKVNQGRIKKLALEEGKTIVTELFPDDSKYGLPMPEEMAAVLAEDPEGDKVFHALSAGKLRTMLYVVSQGTDSDDRIWRAVQVIEHIKKRNGKIDFKALHYQDLRK